MSNQTNNTENVPNVNRLDNNGGYYDYLGNHYPSTQGAKIMDSNFLFPKTHPVQYQHYLFSLQEYQTPGSKTAEQICQAIFQDNERSTRVGYVFKMDTVEAFRARETGLATKLIHRSANPIAVQVNGKTKYFLNYEKMFYAGIVKLGSSDIIPGKFAGEYIDLRKHFNFSAYQTPKDNQGRELFFITEFEGPEAYKDATLYTDIDQAGTTPERIHRIGYRTARVNIRRRFNFYVKMTEQNSVLDNWSNIYRIFKSSASLVLNYNKTTGETDRLYFKSDKLSEMLTQGRRGQGGFMTYVHQETGVVYNGIEYQVIRFNYENYLNLESARIIEGIESLGMCPHCNELHDLAQHDQERCRRRNLRPMRYEYHSQTPAHNLELIKDKTHLIGVEIEKEDLDGVYYDHREIFNSFGWVKERDGSLSSDTGYELVSPMFPLFGTELIDTAKEIESKYNNLINGKFSRACGGHIHYSKKGATGKEQLEEICGYLPLIYSIYKFRTERTYCQAMEKESMKESREKYQAVRILQERIEFRIFPAVKNIETLEWRVNLLQIMAQNPTASPVEVVNFLMDTESDLFKLFARIFDRKTIYKRALDSLKMANKYDRNFYNIDFSSNIKAIEEQAQAL